MELAEAAGWMKSGKDLVVDFEMLGIFDAEPGVKNRVMQLVSLLQECLIKLLNVFNLG